MSWNLQMDSHYVVAPYNSAGSFMDFFAGLTYDHVNFIFAGSSPMQDTVYSPASMGYYKFGYTEPGGTQYYNNGESYEVYDHMLDNDEYSRPPSEPSLSMISERTTATNQQSSGMSNTSLNTSNRDCPRTRDSSQDYQAIWQDHVDPDTMTYEELLELGEAVGTQSRGLTQEQISLLPISRFKCCFLKRKSRCERCPQYPLKHASPEILLAVCDATLCVICQMEYRRKDRLITLPCKHKYHIGCGTKWLSINKACPICYTEVSVDAKRKFQ